MTSRPVGQEGHCFLEKKYIRIFFMNKYYARKRSKVRKKGAQHATVIPRETAK